MQDTQGQTYLGGIAVDITEQKRMEQALRESEERFRVLADNAPVLIWVNGLEGARFVNRAYLEFLGVGEVEVQRYDWTQFVYPEDREAYVNAYLEAFNRRGLFEAQFRFRRADGEYRWMKSRGVPRLTPVGEFLGYVGCTFDITDIKQAEEALRESEGQLHLLTQSLERQVDERTAELARSVEELNQFVYVASHDLKAPLRAVKQLAGWIAQDCGDILPEASKTHLSKLQGRIQRMEKFLDDLLIYSRAGRAYYQSLERIDTGALAKEMIEILAPPPGFTFTIQEDMPLLRSYRTPLELVFKSLIDNAIKHHHRAEGHIQISAQAKGKFIEFTVTDDGPGIDPDFHDHIFQIFQTLKPRDEVEGSGVGLAIAKRAVESQGGTIEVISREGQGATFRFTWPLSF
jgi:PAS domain S-box-containing protein